MNIRRTGASWLIYSCLQISSSSARRLAFSLTPSALPTFTYYHPTRRRQSSLSQAISIASHVFSKRKARAEGQNIISIDPIRMVAKEMKCLTTSLKKLLGSGHPSLDTVAKYYTQSEGKHIRPLIVLLMSRATAMSRKSNIYEEQKISVDDSISPLSVLADQNPSADHIQSSYSNSESDILPTQRRLAEITELIHTASLLHDDVIDHSVSRRGNRSANLEFGNKMAVLAGDFLLGRASVALARLRDAEVTELLATVIANLVEGEFMQLKNTARDEKLPIWTEQTIEYYLRKTYLKTASLISKSCRATALLGGADTQTVDAAYSYGKNLGLAFQLVDDMLDYTKSEKELGKPTGADLELGLATAPLLFAWEHNDELGLLVGRKFANAGDVDRARHLVLESNGLKKTRDLAEQYANQAIEAIKSFPDSEAKDGLEEMAIKTIERRK